MVVQIEPVEIEGKFYVAVVIGSTAMERRGPFPDADAAEAIAARLRRFSRALTSSGGKHG